MMGVILGLTGCPISSKVEHPSGEGQSGVLHLIGGRVADANTAAALPGAQVILQTGASPPVTTYSNSLGLYTLQVREMKKPSEAVVTVISQGYRRGVQPLPAPEKGNQLDFLLYPEVVQVVRAPEPGKKVSDDVPSGIGSNWSGWYTLCTDTLPPDKVIGSTVRFRLEGDRQCGAWAECREAKRTPQAVCWEFRLQGHSEWFPPRPAYSRGILEFSIETTPSNQASIVGKGLVYIQVSSAGLRSVGAKLRDELQSAGYTAPGVEYVPGDYTTEVRYFHLEDREAAQEVVQKSRGVLSQFGKVVGLHYIQGYETSAQSKQFEIWFHE